MTQVHLASAVALLQRAANDFKHVAFATSLGVEDQVLAHLASLHAPRVDLFTLDTGRLHPETLALIAATENFLKRRITVYMPEAVVVEQYIRLNGINGFYNSITQRLHCCQVRKLAPLKRALHGKDAWLTGLRRAQSSTRAQLEAVAFDPQFKLTKMSPLLDWSEAQVWDYAREHGIPTNPLHALGFRSIGCAPCTQATAEGEDVRAGRWWWEAAEHKECGLHK